MVTDYFPLVFTFMYQNWLEARPSTVSQMFLSRALGPQKMYLFFGSRVDHEAFYQSMKHKILYFLLESYKISLLALF